MKHQSISPLRQQMLDAMSVRHFSPNTQTAYVYWVANLAKHYRCSPDRLSDEQLKEYLWHLKLQRHLSYGSCRQALHGVLFFFQEVLQRQITIALLPAMKREQKIPDLLSPAEVSQILAMTRRLKYRTAFMLAYGCGLRVSEIVALTLGDIDSRQQLLHIRHAKGHKDRLVPLPGGVLQALRRYWSAEPFIDFLFCRRGNAHAALNVSCVQKAYLLAKRAARIDKAGGIHGLRHAFATHQLAQGMPLAQLQKILGHQDIRTTLRYTHWLPNYQATDAADFDLVGNLARLS